jgi:hypothetical protein
MKADLQAVSRNGEMAVLLDRPGKDAVLARVPIGGGAPREVLENVRSADWSPDGESLAVVHIGGGRDSLEFPIGHTLYQARGWLSDVAVSPKGDRVALFEHPVATDSRGDVIVVDLAGTKRPSRRDGKTCSARTGRLTGARSGSVHLVEARRPGGTDHALFAATLAGRLRTVMSAPGSLELQDIASDGRALVAHGTRRPSIMALAPGATEESELTWMDFSWVTDLSADGHRLLFAEEGAAGGPGYAVYLRGTDSRRLSGLEKEKRSHSPPMVIRHSR